MSSIDDRLLEAMREIIRQEDARRTFGAVWEYAVTESRVENDVVVFDGNPTATADDVDPFPLPGAVGWTIRVGVAGSSFLPTAGSIVLVTFANRDPRRPRVIGYDSLAPGSLVIDATGVIQIGPSGTRIELGSGSEALTSLPDILAKSVGRLVRWGDAAMMPVGQPPVLTGTLLVPANVGDVLVPTPPVNVSKASG